MTECNDQLHPKAMLQQAISNRVTIRAASAPAAVARAIELAPVLPHGDGERFNGYGVMGVPFATGHYLALRRFPATSIGPAYSSVWWRDQGGSWTIVSDAAPELSCARYMQRAVERTETRSIQLVWCSPWSLRVVVPGLLEWSIELRASARTLLMSRLGRSLPDPVWRSSLFLGVMGRIAGPLLAGGPGVRLRLEGRVPNGQSFQAAPRRVWHVHASRATVDGMDLGLPAPLDRQVKLADVCLPQSGLFFAGHVSFKHLELSPSM